MMAKSVWSSPSSCRSSGAGFAVVSQRESGCFMFFFEPHLIPESIQRACSLGADLPVRNVLAHALPSPRIAVSPAPGRFHDHAIALVEHRQRLRRDHFLTPVGP